MRSVMLHDFAHGRRHDARQNRRYVRRRSASPAGARARVRRWRCGALAQDRTGRCSIPIVVTATRSAGARVRPARVDRHRGPGPRSSRTSLQVNLSESLVRVPGISIQSIAGTTRRTSRSRSRGFGARANFGVRGVRLYQDDIPATMPDGQGQTGSFSLVSAQRIEVLRGPFSTLYGNASGGVISVFTEDGPASRFARGAGDRRQLRRRGTRWRSSTGRRGAVNYVARRQLLPDRRLSRPQRRVARPRQRASSGSPRRPDTTIIVDRQLRSTSRRRRTRSDSRARSGKRTRGRPIPAATLFDTRKTVNQKQGRRHRRAAARRGRRRARDAATAARGTVRQYPRAAGHRRRRLPAASPISTATSAASMRGLLSRFSLGGAAGCSSDARRRLRSQHQRTARIRQQQRQPRRSASQRGRLREQHRRLPAGRVTPPLDALSILAGCALQRRALRLRRSLHHRAQSRRQRQRELHATRARCVGALWHVTDTLNVYANYGQGFETPTFIELAYRPVGTGLNFGLQPAVSNSGEVGLKALIARRCNA